MNRASVSISAIAASHGIMHAYLVLLPALIPLLKGELGDYETIGLLASLVFLFYGWGSLPVGFLADRYPKKALVTASMVLCGLSAISVGLSNSLIQIAASLTLLGVGTSLYHPPGYASMALHSLEMRGRYMGIQGLGGDIGMAISYVTSAILGALAGWRNAFIIWGLIGVAMAALDLAVVIEPESAGDAGSLRRGYVETMKRMFSTEHVRLLALVFLIVICSGALWNGVSSFILTYINEVKGVELILAGGLSSISYTIGAFAQVIGGELSDKRGRRIILLLGFGLFTVFLLVLTVTPASILHMILLVSLLGLTFYITQSPINALLGDISHKETVGTTYGVNFAIKYGIGSFSPAVAGYLAVRYSMDYVFYFFAVISAVAFVATLFVRDVKK